MLLQFYYARAHKVRPMYIKKIERTYDIFRRKFLSGGTVRHSDLHFNATLGDGRNTDAKIMEKRRRMPVYMSHALRSSLPKNSTKSRSIRANISTPRELHGMKYKSYLELILLLVKNAREHFALLKYGVS